MENFLYVAAGLVLLILGGNWLLKSAVALSLRFSIPRMVIGMTVVSLATSAPELIVSLRAALDGSPDIALGNVVGSNIANVGLVLGITLLFGTIKVRTTFLNSDWPALMIATGMFILFIVRDGLLVAWEGGLMVAFLIFFLIYVLFILKDAHPVAEVDDNDLMPWGQTILLLVLGGAGLWAGSEFLINGARSMAQAFGISERIIAITVISVGTSIPELAASVIAMIKKERSISLGNLIGSNIFNLLAVLGISSLITPIQSMDQGLLSNDIYWMIAFSAITLPLAVLPRAMRLQRRDGLVLLLLYALFIYRTLLV